MIFTFFKARGLNVGNSLVEEDFLDLAKKLEATAAEKGVKIIMPTDINIADKFDAAAESKVSLSRKVCVYALVLLLDDFSSR